MEEFSDELHQEFPHDISKKVKESFGKFYTNEGLLDVIEPNSSQIRPNQIMAIGLDFSPIDEEKAREILRLVDEKLYTPRGLKTLDAEDAEYKGIYCGDAYNRDISYAETVR